MGSIVQRPFGSDYFQRNFKRKLHKKRRLSTKTRDVFRCRLSSETKKPNLFTFNTFGGLAYHTPRNTKWHKLAINNNFVSVGMTSKRTWFPHSNICETKNHSQMLR